jgi:hypothetical protein
MGTECSYDYVFVYDGDSFKSPLLGSFSGKTEPQQVTSSSGYVSLPCLFFYITNLFLKLITDHFNFIDANSTIQRYKLCFGWFSCRIFCYRLSKQLYKSWEMYK